MRNRKEIQKALAELRQTERLVKQLLAKIKNEESKTPEALILDGDG